MTTDFTPPDCLFEPLVANANSTLSFPILQGNEVIDPTTGNIVPVIRNSTSITAICHFTKKPNEVSDQFLPGQDQKAIWIRGRCTNPKVMPSGIGHLSQGSLKINGRKGRFILYNPHQNPYVLDALGEEFYGVFLEGEQQ